MRMSGSKLPRQAIVLFLMAVAAFAIARQSAIRKAFAPARAVVPSNNRTPADYSTRGSAEVPTTPVAKSANSASLRAPHNQTARLGKAKEGGERNSADEDKDREGEEEERKQDQPDQAMK